MFGYLDELEIITVDSVDKVIEELKQEMISDQEEHNKHADSPAIVNYAANGSLEERVVTLENNVAALQNMLNQEKALLRKAVLIQLDMKGVYDDSLD